MFILFSRVQLGVFLRRYPIARVLIIVYMVNNIFEGLCERTEYVPQLLN